MTKLEFGKTLLCFSITVIGGGLSACNGTELSSARSGAEGVAAEFVPGSETRDGEGAELGESCHSSDPERYCLALKYVVYSTSKGRPVVSKREMRDNLATINRIWSRCNIAFQADEYLAVNPRDYGLVFNTANASELQRIRRTFDENSTLLVVTTGEWDRDGSLGDTGANAWTNMPGEDVYGVVLESAVGTYSNIIAHELGHYLNLDHFDDQSNVMNSVIYNDSKDLVTSQCGEARAAIRTYWRAMLR